MAEATHKAVPIVTAPKSKKLKAPGLMPYPSIVVMTTKPAMHKLLFDWGRFDNEVTTYHSVSLLSVPGKP